MLLFPKTQPMNQPLQMHLFNKHLKSMTPPMPEDITSCRIWKDYIIYTDNKGEEYYTSRECLWQ